MVDMADEKKDELPLEATKLYTKKEFEAFAAEIARKVVDKEPAYLHSMLAMNHILRQPNLPEVLDADLKDQLKDLWVKLKTTGLHLQDPPILFGIGENTIIYEEAADPTEDPITSEAAAK